MEVILFVYLLMQVLGQTRDQINPDAPADIEVVKFAWSHRRSSVLRERRRERGGAIDQKREFRREVENINALEDRIGNLRELEESVRRDTIESKPVDVYLYSIELKNQGSKVIKLIFFDYQTTAASDPANPSHREFICAVKIKPKSNQSLVAESLLPPSRVIQAAGKEAAPTEKLILNRIEYADGAFWQRQGWHLPDQFPSRSSGRGPCRPL